MVAKGVAQPMLTPCGFLGMKRRAYISREFTGDLRRIKVCAFSQNEAILRR
jgi:hypothetical protein